MSNSNLKTFDNFYADLAQSSYHGRPVKFPYESQREKNKAILDSGGSLYFDFSNDAYVRDEDGKVTEVTPGGKKLDNDGKVYLQP
ncbi:MAG: DUF2974 domain-containing protein, partial [Streptococcus sp.]